MSAREIHDARVERAWLLLLLVIAVAVGLVSASHARDYDPRPDARFVSIGTALVCDRNGCTER